MNNLSNDCSGSKKNTTQKKHISRKLFRPSKFLLFNNSSNRNNNGNSSYKLQILFIILTILLFLSIVGFSFSVFRRGFNFNNEDRRNQADMIYSYVESNEAGNGIMINNALPISDFEGKNLIGENYTFNFTVTFYPNSLNGIYQIVAVKSDDSILPDEAVKLYLTSRISSSGMEQEIKNCINRNNEVKTYDEYKNVNISGVNGKILFSETVTEKLINNHNKYFTFRMWIDKKVNFDSNISNKKFKVKINFYGNTNKEG